MLRRRLLTILFICILLPVLVILVQSTMTIVSQKQLTMDSSGRYVRNLALYAADRWDEGVPDRVGTFLSLVADQGYDMLISIEGAHSRQSAMDARQGISMRGKFVPGLVAYVTLDGQLVSHSQNAAILLNIFNKVLKETGGRAVGGDGHIVGSLNTGERDVTYVAYIAPTSDQRIYAVAAVTMLSWMGRNDTDMIHLASAGILGMLICLVGLFLLHRSVIKPLQSLSSEVAFLKWGKEMPGKSNTRQIGDMQVEEISSLDAAVEDLARRMIEKEELEERYVGDIIKAQEAERGRIAQDIHDGPIQVLSALIQRIQIASMSPAGLPVDARKQLSTAEEIAQDLVEDLRDICDSLIPPWVSLGLASCMEESARRFERQYEIEVHTHIDQSIELPQEVTLVLFRIFQEAISNAVRHGCARTVVLDISSAVDNANGEIALSITDDGQGFELKDEMLKGMLRVGKRGLTGMKQRVGLLGGTLKLDSAPGKGTRITVTLGNTF